jgi:hypothetical protein
MTLARTSISRTRFWSCGCATSAASASWNALGHSEVYRVKCADCRVKVERVPLLPRKAPFSKRFADAVGQASAGSQWFHAPGSSRSGFRRPSACCATAHRTSGWVPAVRARAISKPRPCSRPRAWRSGTHRAPKLRPRGKIHNPAGIGSRPSMGTALALEAPVNSLHAPPAHRMAL